MKKLLTLITLLLTISSAQALRFANPTAGLNKLNTEQLTQRLKETSQQIASLEKQIEEKQQKSLKKYTDAETQRKIDILNHNRQVQQAIKNRLQSLKL